MDYKQKYFKYKAKYLELKYGGGVTPTKRRYSEVKSSNKKLDEFLKDNYFIFKENTSLYHGYSSALNIGSNLWLTLNADDTEQYGNNVAEFEVLEQLKILDLDNIDNKEYISELLGENNQTELLRKFTEAYGSDRVTSRENDLPVVEYLSTLELNYDGIGTRGYKNQEEGDHHDEICIFKKNINKIRIKDTYTRENADEQILEKLGRDQARARKKAREQARENVSLNREYSFMSLLNDASSSQSDSPKRESSFMGLLDDASANN